MLLVGALIACGPAHVGGVVDGEPVGGARDAIFDTVDIDLGWLGHYQGTVVVLTQFPNACEVYDDVFDVVDFTCDDRCDAYLDVVEEHGLRRDRYWSTVLALNTSDGEEGVFDLDPDLGDDAFDAAFYDYDNAPLLDEDACEDACQDGDLLVPDIEEGVDGELEIGRSDGEVLQGRFDLDLGGDDRLDGSFSARPCDMDDWIVWL